MALLHRRAGVRISVPLVAKIAIVLLCYLTIMLYIAFRRGNLIHHKQAQHQVPKAPPGIRPHETYDSMPDIVQHADQIRQHADHTDQLHYTTRKRQAIHTDLQFQNRTYRDKQSNDELHSQNQTPKEQQKIQILQSRKSTPKDQEQNRTLQSRNSTPKDQEQNRTPQSRNSTPKEQEQNRTLQPRNSTPKNQEQNRTPQSRNSTPKEQEQNRTPQSRNSTPKEQEQNRTPQSRNSTPKEQEQNQTPQSRNSTPEKQHQIQDFQSQSPTPKEQQRHQTLPSQYPTLQPFHRTPETARVYSIPESPTQPQPPKPANITCQFPELDHFDPKIMTFIKTYPTIQCHGNIPSVVDAFEDELRVDKAGAKVKLKSGAVDACSYRNISMRPGDSFEIEYGPWSEDFTSSITILAHEEYLHVECFYNNSLVAVSYITLVKKNKRLEYERSQDFVRHLQKKKPNESLSILLIGIDGMSRQNLIRAMPKTRNYLLEQLGAVEFKKVNKVGLNTFPNIIPLLTGRHVDELPTYWNVNKTFDSINHLFLWNRYQKAGYRSALMLDNTYSNAFHYMKKGWVNIPVDYFPRPVVLASEFEERFYRNTTQDCMGQVPELTYLFKYWLDFAGLFNDSATPYFGYGFFNRLSHDNQNKASAGDDLYLEFFKEISARNLLQKTLMIFFSDHGLRFGEVADTFTGLMEAKTPFLQFIFPQWFQRKYPKLMSNFRTNADRLTTMFDVHATLADLLTFSGKSQMTAHDSHYRGIPLFSEIPSTRSCKDAGIPIEFCTCNSFSMEKPTPEHVTKVVVDEMMKRIVNATSLHRDQCAPLQHNRTKMVVALIAEVPFTDKDDQLYHVIIETTPGGALYDATLLYNDYYRDAFLMGEIVRLNMYRGQAECMTEERLRSFCFCKDIKQGS